MEDMIQEKVTQKENELNATYDEKMRNYEERYVLQWRIFGLPQTLSLSEQDLQRQVALTKNQLRELRMSHDSNQAKLLDHTQRQGTLRNTYTSGSRHFFNKISLTSWLPCRPGSRVQVVRIGYDGC